jgi:hypothetical protein
MLCEQRLETGVRSEGLHVRNTEKVNEETGARVDRRCSMRSRWRRIAQHERRWASSPSSDPPLAQEDGACLMPEAVAGNLGQRWSFRILRVEVNGDCGLVEEWNVLFDG